MQQTNDLETYTTDTKKTIACQVFDKFSVKSTLIKHEAIHKNHSKNFKKVHEFKTMQLFMTN